MPVPDGPPGLHLDDVVPYLLAHGLVLHEDVAAPGFAVLDRSRRNRSFQAMPVRGGGVVLKQATRPDDAAGAAAIRREAELLRALGTEPALARLRWCTPRLVLHDAGAAALATELVRPATSMTKDHLNGGEPHFPRDAAVTAARILATLHADGGGAARKDLLPSLERLPPSALALPQPRPAPARPALAAYHALLAEVPDWPARAAPLADAWARAGDLVHMDARWDNFLLTAGAAPGGNLNVRLIDWELAALGDGVWDAATFLAEYVRFWLLPLSGRAAGDPDPTAAQLFPLETCHDAARAFWATYLHRRRFRPGSRRAATERLLAYLPFALALIGREQLQDREDLPASSRVAATMVREAALGSRQAARAWFGIDAEVA